MITFNNFSLKYISQKSYDDYISKIELLPSHVHAVLILDFIFMLIIKDLYLHIMVLLP